MGRAFDPDALSHTTGGAFFSDRVTLGSVKSRGRGERMDHDKPLLIKRYASRRLYNTETSDYVTLEDLARVIQGGRDVSVIDLKTGDDVTRQYLLQIIAEHEAKGRNVLPLGLLTDLIRSYSSEAEAVIPQFLAATFQPEAQPVDPRGWQGRPTKDLAEIRQQLADLQDRLARL